MKTFVFLVNIVTLFSLKLIKTEAFDFQTRYDKPSLRSSSDTANMVNYPANYGPDKTIELIKDSILVEMKNLENSTNIGLKQKLTGSLPDSFPVSQQHEATRYHNNRMNWQSIMQFPFEIWRSCVFPDRYISYVTVCSTSLGLKSEFLYNVCN